ncbi:flagellar hook-length control protein FliK [Alishewanella longhuensis]
MTQGLQFSLLFSALDSHAAADSAVFVPEQQEASYGEQADAFRQVLESEQQSKASNKGQTVAAPQVTQHRESKERPVETVILPKNTASDLPATVPDTEAAAAELSQVTENVADQWLGLIRQSSDASTLLRKKAELAAQSGFALETAKPDELKMEFERLPMLNTDAELRDTDVASQKALLAASIKQLFEKEQQQVSLSKAELADAKPPIVDSSDAAKDRVETSKIAAQVPDKSPNQADKLGNDAATSVAQAKASLLNEQTLTSSQDPTAMVELAEKTASTSQERQSAFLANAPEEAPKIKAPQSELSSSAFKAKAPQSELSKSASKVKVLQSELSDSASKVKAPQSELSDSVSKVKVLQSELSDSASKVKVLQSELSSAAVSTKTSLVRPEGALNAAALTEENTLTALEQGVVSDSTTQRSVVESGNLEEKASAKKLADNAAMAASKTLLSDSNSSDSTDLLQETAQSESDHPITAAFAAPSSSQEKPLKDVAATVQTITSSASKQQSETAEVRELSVGQQAKLHSNNELTAPQAELAAMSGINSSANNNSTTKMAALAPEYGNATNESGKLSMIKASTDAAEKEPQSEQNQQRQDSRQYQFNRLEVTLQQSGVQNAALQRTAALDNVVETNNTLLRAEQFSSLLEQQSRPQSATTAAPSLAAQLKQLNLQQQDAAGQLRERVQLMVRQNVQFAEIRLDPAELGQMQIRINLQQEQATVQFIVQQQHAKELLEQQMPRLRELLQQQGMQLGEGQVQQQAKDDRQTAGQQSGHAQQQQGQAAEQDDTTQTVSMQVRRSERLVDYYA